MATAIGMADLTPKLPGLVRGGQHDGTVGGVAHNNGLSHECRAAAQFHGDKERIHVHVHDAAPPELAQLRLAEPPGCALGRLLPLLFILVRPHNFNPMPRD